MTRPILLITFLIVLISHVEAKQADYSALINGTLTGDAAEEASKDFYRDFKQYRSEKRRYRPLYELYVDKIGVKEISKVLEADSASCHAVGHALGAIVGKRVSDLNTGMKICASTCTYGCLHGVFKVYFNNLGKAYHEHSDHGGEHHSHDKATNKQVVFTKAELNKFSHDVNVACSKSDSVVDGFFQGNCAHGVGHAMAKLAQSVALANSYCRVFPQVDMQYYCETGVFMELAGKIKNDLFSKSYKRSEKVKMGLAYCGKESNYPSACLRFILPGNRSLGQITRYAFICERQEDYLKSHCFNALGYHSRTYIAKNPAEFLYACSRGNAESQASCISGVTLMKKGQKYRSAIKNACSLLESKAQQVLCEKQSDSYYYQLNNDYFSSLMKPT